VQVPQNSFVGRDADLDTVRDLLGRERWVTVVGAAGCGKTRLALELAAGDARTPVVAELEHVPASDVASAVARAIGLGIDSAANPLTACAVALETQPHLLVLDNCDRVVDAVGRVVGSLLASVRTLTVLATSRAPIGSSDETVYPLAPLAIDGPLHGAAVQLLLDRAASAAPAVELSDGDGDVLARICRRLDGLPLAIELAAARVRHLPLAELAARLDEGFGPLDRAGSAGRHSTLEAAFDWTWDLLDDDERTVLAQLAALPVSFDLALADAVAAPGAADVVLRLLDRSLLTRAGADGGPQRFRLLASLRAFVLDRTSASVVEQVRRAHAVHYAALATDLAARAHTDDSWAATMAAKRLLPEVCAAIDWTLARQDELTLVLAPSLAVLGEQYGTDASTLEVLTRVAHDPFIRRTARATDIFWLSMALGYGDLDVLVDLSALTMALVTDDESALAAHHLAGWSAAYARKSDAALEHFAIAERLADERQELWQLAHIHQGKGVVFRDLNEPAASMASFETGMQTFALAGDAMHVNNARYMMAATAADTGYRAEEAVAWADQCAAYARTCGNNHELAHALLTRARLCTGSQCEADLDDAIASFRAVGDLRCLTRGYLRLADGQPTAERVAYLDQALDFARRAHDIGNQTTTLERLIGTHWAAGDAQKAGSALGELIGLIGDVDATSRCPADMVADLHRWSGAIAEGRARVPQAR
jgi:predicted ATPase